MAKFTARLTTPDGTKELTIYADRIIPDGTNLRFRQGVREVVTIPATRVRMLLQTIDDERDDNTTDTPATG